MTRRPWIWGIAAGVVLLSVADRPASAQGYRLRLESRAQSVAFRGVQLDSIPASQVVVGAGGGLFTVDGFAVDCIPGSAYCFYFRPGTRQTAAPSVTSADFTLWGLGVRGLSVHGSARIAVDLGDADVWPGTQPALQLLEAYAEYSSEVVTGRLGRQVYTSRLGFTGFDGARLTLRSTRWGIEGGGYLGEGLARGIALPVTSEALNPLDDFQPRDRQIVAGATAALTRGPGELRLDYQREVDPLSDYFVSERAAMAGSLRPAARLSILAGAEYDIARGFWGSADASVRYFAPAWTAGVGVMRYRPHFDLWTIWGAFSPVAYHAVTGSASVSVIPNLQLRARGSRFWYQDAEAETPLTEGEDRGWRIGLGATWTPRPAWHLEVGHEAEFGPGGSYASYDAALSWEARNNLALSVHGAKLTRPLEFRFNEAALHLLGAEATWRPSDRWELDLGVTRYMEERNRPDAAAFDWDQTRLTARLRFLMGSGADQFRLPKGRMPTDGGSRTP